MDQDKSTENSSVEFNSQNIFDEFSEGQAIGDEVQKIEKQEERDLYFYIKKGNSFLLICNLLLFIGVSLLLVYSYVQNSDKKSEYSFLSPICSLFLGDIPVGETCYGAQAILNEYEDKLQTLKKSQAQEILPLLGDMYSIENFNLSRKVSFLLDKTSTRLRPLEIITAFDELKGKFSPIDKSQVSCYDITIAQGNTLDITCDIFSSDWDTQVTALKGDSTVNLGGGTSVSLASSFIYFLEHHLDSNFQMIEKPSSFSREQVQEGPYTQRTVIKMKLQYNNPSSLSF